MRPRVPLPASLAARPFARGEAIALGVGDGRLRGPDLDRPFHGVRAPAAHRDLLEACRAFMPRMPPAGFFNSLTAAALMGLPLPPRLAGDTRLHVAVPAPTRGLKARGVVGHKVVLMGGDLRLWHDLPLSSPERVFCELGGLLSLGELVAVGDQLIHWRLPVCPVAELEDARLRYPGQRGRGRLSIALGLLDDRAESAPESMLRVILAQAGLTGFVANHPVRVRGRSFRIDLAFPDAMVALEYQGDYHRDPEQWRRDMTRRSTLVAEGWLVLEINADDLRNPAELVARVRSALATHRGVPNRP